MGYLKKYWPYMFLIGFCLVASTGFELAVPWIARTIIDEALPKMDYQALGWLSFAVVGVAVLRGVTRFIQRYHSEYVGQRVVYDLRNQLYQSLERQSFRFYDRNPTGQLMSRVTSDVNAIQRLLAWSLMELIGTITRFVGAFAILVSLSPTLMTLALSPAPVLLYLTLRFSKRVHEVFYNVQMKLGALTAVLQENIAGVRVVRAFASESHEEEKFRRANREYVDAVVTAAKIRALYMPFMDFIVAAGTVFIIWYGGSLVVAGQLSLGSFIAFIGYLGILMMPIRFLGFMASSVQEAMAGARRIFEILDAAPDVVDRPNAIDLVEVKGHVTLENVSFQYADGQMALKGVSLEAKPGETVALLGPTGSGKSTVIQLIPRFYDVTSGRVTVDGHDVRDVKVASLRKNIGIVLQETFLFTGTIRENIAYGRPDASMEEIVEAAKAAGAHDFIISFPEGYESRVGERGVNLSGGQKQRIAIARALLMNPRILILDDSTSSVDVDTEYEIQRALRALMKGRTNFVITQRLSTVRGADKIVVLENGQVAESGTHEELLARNGLYARLYYTQLTEGRGELAPKLVAGGRA
ncbi:MAG: ABC transporter ATP-binding protein [Candidatus Bathyarchaeia archaeon]